MVSVSQCQCLLQYHLMHDRTRTYRRLQYVRSRVFVNVPAASAASMAFITSWSSVHRSAAWSLHCPKLRFLSFRSNVSGIDFSAIKTTP